MKYILAIIFLFLCTKSVAQTNLVMNPSLEMYSHCPDAYDEIKYANHWMSLDSSWSPPDWAHDSSGVPEYCNVCGTAGGNIPYNGYYYNYPRTGNGMAEVIMYSDQYGYFPYLRDYMQGHLSSALVAGQSYCVTFYVALEQGSTYAIDHIGAYLDNGTIDTTHNFQGIHSEITPQVFSPTIILDTATMDTARYTWSWWGKWVKIEGSFVANGTERLITIANFSDKAHTNTIPLLDTIGASTSGISALTWYLVDDISVIASTASPNAGPDQTIPIGGLDSVTIGDTTDTYLPVTWYVNGIAIDSNTAVLKVKPDTTTTYVEALFMCGGEVKYDTVTVFVGTLGNVGNVTNVGSVKIFPNPAHDVINITFGEGCEVVVYDMVGRLWGRHTMTSNKEAIDISGMEIGVYMVEVTDRATGEKVVRRVVKE